MISVVTNHWGWSLAGIARWIRFGWARPVAVWGVEISGSVPRAYQRRVKVLVFCFPLGSYVTQEDQERHERHAMATELVNEVRRRNWKIATTKET
jgi:hypothetical protein